MVTSERMSERGRPRHSNHTQKKEKKNERTNEGKGVGRQKKKRKKSQGKRRRRNFQINSTVDGQRPCRRSLVHSSSSSFSSFSFHHQNIRDLLQSRPPENIQTSSSAFSLPHKRQRVTCGHNQLLDQRSTADTYPQIAPVSPYIFHV